MTDTLGLDLKQFDCNANNRHTVVIKARDNLEGPISLVPCSRMHLLLLGVTGAATQTGGNPKDTNALLALFIYFSLVSSALAFETLALIS